MRRSLWSFVIAGWFWACGVAPDGLGAGGYAHSPCGACVADACAEPLRACGADSRCAQSLWCLGSCPAGARGDANADCEARCAAAATGSSLLLWQATVQCRSLGVGAALCASACGTTQPTGAAQFYPQCQQPSPPPLASLSCAQCTAQRCCDAQDACQRSECSQIVTCINTTCLGDDADPSFQPCVAACRRSHREGRANKDRLQLCQQVRCAQECFKPAPHLACVSCEAQFCADLLVRFQTQASCLDARWCDIDCAPADMACQQRCDQTIAQCVTEALGPLLFCAKKYCPEIC